MRIDIGQLEFIDKKLREIVISMEKYFGFDFTITSLYRIGDQGVHGILPLRAIDFRCKSRLLGTNIANIVNMTWIYDDLRPEMKCAMVHNVGVGMHLHIQVHQNTKRRKK